jgi:hypothetical protein
MRIDGSDEALELQGLGVVYFWKQMVNSVGARL